MLRHGLIHWAFLSPVGEGLNGLGGRNFATPLSLIIEARKWCNVTERVFHYKANNRGQCVWSWLKIMQESRLFWKLWTYSIHFWVKAVKNNCVLFIRALLHGKQLATGSRIGYETHLSWSIQVQGILGTRNGRFEGEPYKMNNKILPLFIC